jgi:hypothetical protein
MVTEITSNNKNQINVKYVCLPNTVTYFACWSLSSYVATITT